MNLKIKIKAKQFANSFVMNFQGKTTTKRCICIPLEDNNIFESEKTGECYIELVAIERKQPSQYGDTHFLKINYPKEMTDALTEEQRKALPIIGDLAPMQKQIPPTPTYTPPTPNDNLPSGDNQPSGDLPF